MPTQTVIRRGYYQDSVALMRLSTALSALPGVRQAAAQMATEANKELLEKAGLLTDEARQAQPNDLSLVIEAENAEALAKTLEEAERLLAQEPDAGSGTRVERQARTVASGVQLLPEANLLLISTPGQYAAAEALKGLKAGLHIFLFSDNVPIEQEVALKRLARERGLLVMGPDCGTCIIAGVALGFANVVRRGNIGVVGPAGTGIQEVTVLIDRFGGGISHAIGTGSHDISAEVGAITTLQALDALAADPGTEVVVIVAKPSAPEVVAQVVERCRQLGKPVVANFLGLAPGQIDLAGVTAAHTLEQAAALAVAAAQRRPANAGSDGVAASEGVAREAHARLAPGQRYIRGLFSGGTLVAEALVVLDDLGLATHSNVGSARGQRLADLATSVEHTLIDMGADEFTVGRPHPMIDFRARLERLRREAADPEVAVILLDVVLGYGAHADPAFDLAPAIAAARAEAAKAGRNLAIVGSVCGTEGDPQPLSSQEQRLREAGMLVLPSNAQAARVAAAIAVGQASAVGG
ncbi:MAG: acyl-CoA synthetase FdrA [Chloroflexota bacterium]